MQEALSELSVQAGYAAWAHLYDDDGNPLTALEGPAVQAWFGPVVGRRVLDLGCGTGRHTLALIQAGASEITALDMTPEMLAIARAKVGDRFPPVRWLQHALPDPLPFRDGTFDLVVLGLVAEHVVDLPHALGEVVRVLSPGGRFIMSALHPDRTAEGQRARFIDPQTGLRQPIATIHRTIEQYLVTARSAGLHLDGEHSLVVSQELADRLPRARNYLGRSLAWVACWKQPERAIVHCDGQSRHQQAV